MFISQSTDEKMKLEEIYLKEKEPVISYEVFPPKEDFDGKKLEKLFSELKKLKQFNPSLISVTYGAGGSNQNESIEIISRIKNELKITPMPHFTCVSTSEHNIKSYLKNIESLGVENILALRGDIPENGEICKDFEYASDLVSCIKKESTLSVAVAGYPEGHKEAVSLQKDIEYLKKKVDLGAKIVYTQLFFNNSHFFTFVEMCQKQGIYIPVIPGILPVSSYKQLEKMASLCKVEVPETLAKVLEQHKDDKDYIKKYGTEFASNQCIELLQKGVRGLHFYTLNKADAVSEILSNLLLTKETL